MNNFLDTNTSRADRSLAPEERERMRNVVHAYMEMKPLRARQKSAARPAWYWGLLFSPRAIAFVLVAALFASSAGVSYAAQSALPGDALYAIKVKVNEPIQGALATSASDKAAWAIGVAGERVKEAAALAAAGRLSTSTQDALQQNFETHAQLAADAIQTEASSSPEVGAEVAVSAQAQLDEYSRILAQVGIATGIDTRPLSASIKHESSHVASIRAEAEANLAASSTDNVAVAVAAARVQKSAQAQIYASWELVKSSSRALASSSLSQVAAQLDTASTSLSDGDKLLGTNAPGAALGAFQSALSASAKLGVFLETSAAIHARTGLVIDEPQVQAGAAATTTRIEAKKKDHERRFMSAAVATTTRADGGEERPPITAETASTSFGATATDTENGSAPASRSDLLPVSVPVAVSPSF